MDAKEHRRTRWDPKDNQRGLRPSALCTSLRPSCFLCVLRVEAFVLSTGIQTGGFGHLDLDYVVPIRPVRHLRHRDDVLRAPQADARDDLRAPGAWAEVVVGNERA